MRIDKIFSSLFLVVVTFLDADTVLALLKKIENNHTFYMSERQNSFVCVPYGVETLSQLADHTDVNSTCMQYLNDFRQANPYEKFYAQSVLHVQQLYSVEGLKNRCLLFFSSNVSYSERLLEHGYAWIPFNFKYEDPFLDYRFKRVQARAKKSRKGIWSDTNLVNCLRIENKR